MLTLLESGAALRVRRMDMGITQAALARISGLSRATVNQLESGAVKNLSVNKLASLFEAVGLAIQVSAPRITKTARTRSARSALALAVQTASVSYRLRWRVHGLRKALVTGDLSVQFEPHAYTLLDEAPIALLASVVEQTYAETGVVHSTLWRNLRAIAQRLKSRRGIWQ